MHLSQLVSTKKFILSLILGGLLILLGTIVAHSSRIVHAQTTSGNAHGYVQAANIGWISANCADMGVCSTSPYWVNVTRSTNGQSATFSGYGWSPNIGWVSFNASDVAYCGSPAVVNLATGTTTGWARAIAGNTPGSGGWNGCISMSGGSGSAVYGVTYSTSTKAFGGYAWGSIVVGWVDFTGLTADLDASSVTNPPQGNTPGFTFLVNGDKTAAISSGSSIQLSWQTLGIGSCTGSGDWSQTFTGKDVADGNHTFIVQNVTSPKSYTMSCTLVTPSSGPLPAQTVTVTIRPQSCEVVPDKFVVKAGASPIATTVRFGAQWISTTGYPNVTIGAGAVTPSGSGTSIGTITGNPVTSTAKYATIPVNSTSAITQTQTVQISGSTSVSGAQSCTPATLYIVPPGKCLDVAAKNTGDSLPCTYDVNTKPKTKRPPWIEI